MQTIWKRDTDLAKLNELGQNTLVHHLGIEFVAVSGDALMATMPVDARTHQPFGMLHGGASASLAETLGSMAANMAVDQNHYCVGLEINANHMRAVRSGTVTGTARPLHLGQSTQVWDITIVNEAQQLVCVSRLTMAVLS
jgi:1,4-dihydroxy-2-naphthoyl-CoA hydrolase